MADQEYQSNQHAHEANNGNYSHLDDSDDDEDARKLFVGGLSNDTTDEDLRTHFAAHGEVQHAVVKFDKTSGISRGFGFVTYSKVEDMKRSLENNQHVLKSKKIDPKQAQPSREVQKKIFVGGVPKEVDADTIREYFKQFGKIEKIDTPTEFSTKERKPFIFITFHSEKGAKRAIEEEKQNIFGKQCDVRIAIQKNNQRQSQGGYGGYGAPSGDGGYYNQQQSYDYYQTPYQQYDPNMYQNYSGYQGYPQYQGYGGYPQGQQTGYQQNAQNNSRGGGKIRGGNAGAAHTGRGGGAYHPYPRQQQ